MPSVCSSCSSVVCSACRAIPVHRSSRCASTQTSCQANPWPSMHSSGCWTRTSGSSSGGSTGTPAGRVPGCWCRCASAQAVRQNSRRLSGCQEREEHRESTRESTEEGENTEGEGEGGGMPEPHLVCVAYDMTCPFLMLHFQGDWFH